MYRILKFCEEFVVISIYVKYEDWVYLPAKRGQLSYKKFHIKFCMSINSVILSSQSEKVAKTKYS